MQKDLWSVELSILGVKETHRHRSSEADNAVLGGRVDRCGWQCKQACSYRKNITLSFTIGKQW